MVSVFMAIGVLVVGVLFMRNGVRAISQKFTPYCSLVASAAIEDIRQIFILGTISVGVFAGNIRRNLMPYNPSEFYVTEIL